MADTEGELVTTQETKPRGRTRFCKTCKFSSTDAKEFQHHQMYAHNAEENRALDKEIQAQKLEPRRKSLTGASRSPRRSRDDCEGSQHTSPIVEQKQPSDQPEKVNGVSGDEEQIKLSDMEMIEVKKGPVKRTGNIQTRNYVCVKCAFDTTSAKVFLHHQVDEHQENISIFECDLCDYATKYKQKLPRHRKLHFTAREGGDAVDGDMSAISLTSDLDGTEEGTDSIDGGPTAAEENSEMTNGFIELGFEDLENSEKMDESDGAEVVNSEVDEEEGAEMQPEPEVVPAAPAKTPPAAAGESIVPRKKAPRQEVDPRKYVVIHSDKGVKYACSRCTSVYSWRKSLNKHWKEKHPGDLPDARVKAKKLAELSENDPYTTSAGDPAAVAAFRGHHGYGNFGPPLTSSPVLNIPRSRSSTPLSSTGMPVNIANYSHPVKSFKTESYNAPPMPNVIGPFVTNSIRPTYMNESNGEEEPSASDIMYRMDPEVLDLSRTAKQEPEEEPDMMDDDEDLQDEPLDFSFKPAAKPPSSLGVKHCGTSSVRALLENGTLEGHYMFNKVHVKPEPVWSGDENENFQSDNLNIESKTASVSPQKSSPRNHVLQCSRCAYVAKTLVDYSAHMGIHLNKRAFKCAECQEHFGGVDELNEHFSDKHSEKILKHKEAIQKIPHGLLQTYHLLNVPVNKLSALSNSSYTTTGEKQLKCNMCGFLARWPAELQKHAVSHSEERPFVCMVCGSTYKWKWDLVKHFEKSHHTLPNPYKRRDPGSQQSPSSSSSTSTAAALLDDNRSLPTERDESTMEDDEPSKKRRRLSDSDLSQIMTSNNNANTLTNPDANNNEDHEEPSDDCKLLSQDYETEYLAALEMRRVVPANRDSASQLEISDMADGRPDSGEDVEFDPEDPGPYMQYCRPINEMTQKIMAETLRQRISMGKLSPSDENQSFGDPSSADILLPYKCPSCEYRARWPSEITQHMKNHSDEKPFRCPRCSYRSKWKWDVVKHLKRCGGGTIKDVIDTSMEEQQVLEINESNILLTVPNADGQSNAQPVTYLVGPFSTPPPVQKGQQVAVLPTAGFQGGRMTVRGPCPNVTVLPPNSSGMVGIPSAGPMQNSPESALSPNSAGKQPNQPVKQPVFRGIINDGMYHCLHCPFVGHSPAELKRHAIIHSEDRPFTCSTCGYSSKWKGDLKKHLRTYNHAGIIQGLPTNRPILPRPAEQSATSTLSPPPTLSLLGEVEEPKPAGDGTALMFHEKLLFKCSRCPYVTYKKSSYDAHVKVHGPAGSTDGPSKFKCKQCQFQAHDLSTFLQHRVTHTQAAQMTVPTKQPVAPSQMHDHEVSSRTIHLKYRRKPIKQFRCFKCPYVCFKRSGLDLHIAMHEPRGIDAYKCLFCDYNVYSRSLLMQHMRLHSEYDPAIHSDIITEGENRSDFGSMQQQEMNEQMDSVIDLTTHTPYHNNNVPALAVKPSPVLAGKKKQLACEWCSATFDHLLNLYQHAQSSHPKELSAQEVKEKRPIDFSQTSNPLDFSQKQRPAADYFQKAKPGVSLLTGTVQNNYMHAARGFTTPKNYPPIMPKTSASTPNHIDQSKQAWLLNARKNTNIKSPVAARKSTSPAKRSPRHQCTKCPFIASNLFSYYRHMERHGSNCKHTCPYCDYSINRLNLLYQHMKGAHNIHWYSGEGRNMLAELKGMPKHKTPTSADSSRTSTPSADRVSTPTGSASTPKTENLQNSTELDQASFESDGAEDLSSDFLEKYSIQAAESQRHLSMASPRHPGGKPTLVIVEETNWRGIPIQICFLDGRKNYKCPICNYISNNAANATNHVRQHGTNRKYRCDYCNYSVDNLRLVYHHMESIHRNCPYNTVERIEKTSSGESLELQLDEEANSPTAEEMVNNVLDTKVVSQLETALRQNSATRVSKDDPPRRSIECSFCPFRAKNKDSYTKHLEMHEYSGRYRCKHCSYSADRLNLMTQHSRVHSPPGEAEGNLGSLSLIQENRPLHLQPTAGQLLASSSLAAKHKTVNMNSRVNGRIRYRCSRCPFKTFCKSNIIKHRRQHLIMGKYKCQKCNYSAMRWYVLQQHMKFHELEAPEEKLKDGFQDFVLDPDDEEAAEALRQAEPGTLPNTEASDEMTGDPDMEDMDDEEMGESEELNDFDSEQDMEGMECKNFEGMEVDEALNEDAQQGTYQCKSCPFSAGSITEIRKHFRLHKLALKFRCDICSYSIDRLNVITEHRKLHAEEPDFHADVPADSLLNPDYAEKSASPIANSEDSGMEKLMVRSGSMSEESMRFTCSMCPHQCNYVKNLNVHMSMHGKNAKFICDYCSWSADRLNLLYQHRKVHSKEPDYDQTPEDIKFLNREYALGAGTSPVVEQSEDSSGENGQDEEGTEDEAHVELVRSDSGPASPSTIGEQNRVKRLYNCTLCPFSCNNKSSFAYHKNLHRIPAKYTCTHCSYSVARWNLLRQHMQVHGESKDVQDQKRLRCPTCPYHSRSKALLDVHIAMHTSGKKYSCDFCDYSIDQYNLLQQHLKVHSTITLEAKDSPEFRNSEFKDFEPPESGTSRSLLYFNGLKNATDEDSMDAEFKCNRCPFSTAARETFEAHEQRHDVRDTTECPYCDYSCPDLDELLIHVRLHFPSTQMDKSTLQTLMSKNGKKKKSDMLTKMSSLDASEDSVQTTDDKGAKTEGVDGSDEQNEEAAGDTDEAMSPKDSSKPEQPKTTPRTKVYVCQYCEREFEDKTLMRQHESQHLIGSQY